MSLFRFGNDIHRFVPRVREFEGVGTGFADLYLAEGVTARVALELLRPAGHRRQPTEQTCDYE